MLQTTFLYYLVQISHYQSLSIAAEKLHVSQPALSAGIKKLEEQLGVKLLDRTYKGVSLTNEGNEVVKLAEKAFVYLDEIETMYQQTNDTAEENHIFDNLILYSNPAFSPLLMSALSSHSYFQKQFLQINDLTPTFNLKELLENPNVVILGIISDTHKLLDNQKFITLSTSQSYIICSQEFPYIAPTQSSISFKELVQIPMVVSKNAFDFQHILLDKVRDFGEPNIKIVAPNSVANTSAIHAGIVAGFSNKFFLSHETDTLRTIPIRNAPKFHLSLVFNVNADMHKIAALAKIIKKVLL